MAVRASELVVVCLDPPSENDSALCALAEFLGINASRSELCGLLSTAPPRKGEEITGSLRQWRPGRWRLLRNTVLKNSFEPF